MDGIRRTVDKKGEVNIWTGNEEGAHYNSIWNKGHISLGLSLRTSSTKEICVTAQLSHILREKEQLIRLSY